MITRLAHWSHGAFSTAKDAYDNLEVVHFAAAVLVSVLVVAVTALSIGRRRKKQRQTLVDEAGAGRPNGRRDAAALARLEQEEREWKGKRNRRRVVYLVAFLVSTYVIYKFAVTWSRLSRERITSRPRPAEGSTTDKGEYRNKEGGGTRMDASSSATAANDGINSIGSVKSVDSDDDEDSRASNDGGSSARARRGVMEGSWRGHHAASDESGASRILSYIQRGGADPSF